MTVPTLYEYPREIPRAVQPGDVLVHNRVRAVSTSQRQGRDGFRFWLAKKSERWTRCDCGWAPHLPEHYRSGAAAAMTRRGQ
jgi:hypothetical protein